MIVHEIVRDLLQAAAGLERIAQDHGKCLACHCYREVAESLVDSLDELRGHAEILDTGLPRESTGQEARLRLLLRTSPGTHG